MMFKTEKVHRRSLYMHPFLSIILIDMYWYCIDKEIPFTVTSTFTTKEEDEEVSRRHDTHRTGRAFDLSVRNWSRREVDNFCRHFNDKYREHAAFSSSTKERRLCVFHLGTAWHIHVQLDRKYTVKDVILPLDLI